jgi:hypothetical protein
MWEFEYSLDTAAPDSLWRYWSNLTTWPQWNDGIEKIETDGPFAVGTTFTMTPPEGDPITLRLVEIVPGSCSPTRWTPVTSRCEPCTGLSRRRRG